MKISEHNLVRCVSVIDVLLILWIGMGLPWLWVEYFERLDVNHPGSVYSNPAMNAATFQVMVCVISAVIASICGVIGLKLYALLKGRWYTFVQLSSALMMLLFPLGTISGVLTFLVLRDRGVEL